MDKRYVTIHRAHFGSQMELRYKLSSYGIPADLLPLLHQGKLKFENHHNFLNMQIAKLWSKPGDREIVDCPGSEDVVFRKGPWFKLNTGNHFYRDILQDRSLGYFAGDLATKKEIALSIIEDVENRNGRFLEWTKDKKWLVFQNRDDICKKVLASLKQFTRNRHKERA